jgi:hypothetical protein
LVSINAFPRLERLDVSDCNELTGDEVIHLATHHPSLNVLMVDHCRGVANQERELLVHLLNSKSFTPADASAAPASPTREQMVQQLVDFGIPADDAVDALVRHGTLHRALRALGFE